MRPLILHNLQLDLSGRRYRSAVLGASRLVESRPQDAEALYWLGEAYRALGPRRARLSPDELGYWSQRRAYLDEHNRTEEDQAKRLSAKPEGLAALRENQAKAKECFEKAVALDPASAPAQLGLGMLYQDQGKSAEALASYARYLQLAPDAPDRLRVERRVEALRQGGSR
jgi:tetratricopeptide (TPR) repeat protein